MDPFIAQIMMFAGTFEPKGWAFCNGQLMSIAQNTALFSLIGTTYGGDGVQTFALPDLRGRAPIHAGNGPGLTPRTEGEAGGSEQVTLTTSQIPAHNHLLSAQGAAGTLQDPSNNYPSQSRGNDYVPALTTPITMNPGVLTQTGGNQPHNNMQPYLTINFIIALEGIYPSRS